MAQAGIERLPTELLSHIISYLVTNGSSRDSSWSLPNMKIRSSVDGALKSLCRTSSRFRAIAQPLLFSHCCYELDDQEDFLHFLAASGLHRYVESITVRAKSSDTTSVYALWWHQVLECVDPWSITVIAPPKAIGDIFAAEVYEGHSWAFGIDLQAVRLERDRRIPRAPALSTDLHSTASILAARPWTSLSFSESSSLRAYNHYEYFLYRVPSFLGGWGSLRQDHPLQTIPTMIHVDGLTSFHYTAVFPFYNHVRLVLDAVEFMNNLQTFSVQLAPGQHDNVTEEEQRGSIDPSDPWMEIYTGYSLIAHSVRHWWYRGSLRRLNALDYAHKVVRSEISEVIQEILAPDGWQHDGEGGWSKSAFNVESVPTDESPGSLSDP